MLARRALLRTWPAWATSRSARRGTGGRRTMGLAADGGHVAFPACVLRRNVSRPWRRARVHRCTSYLTRRWRRVLGTWLASSSWSGPAAISWRSPISGTVPLGSSARAHPPDDPGPLQPCPRVAQQCKTGRRRPAVDARQHAKARTFRRGKGAMARPPRTQTPPIASHQLGQKSATGSWRANILW
jgi:hypothetical protein